MTDNERIAKLTELAKRAWPGANPITHLDAGYDGLTLPYAWIEIDERYVFGVAHLQAFDALETALCVLAGEAPLWAVDLAKQWQRAHAEHWPIDQREQSACGAMHLCAAELLAAAKRGGQ